MTTIKYRMAVLLALAIALCGGVACGQKGDLYLPDKSAKQHDLVAR
jgi:predicted small lipoprotein YifL